MGSFASVRSLEGKGWPFPPLSDLGKLNRASWLLNRAIDTVINEPVRRQAGQRYRLRSLSAAAVDAVPTAGTIIERGTAPIYRTSTGVRRVKGNGCNGAGRTKRPHVGNFALMLFQLIDIRADIQPIRGTMATGYVRRTV